MCLRVCLCVCVRAESKITILRRGAMHARTVCTRGQALWKKSKEADPFFVRGAGAVMVRVCSPAAAPQGKQKQTLLHRKRQNVAAFIRGSSCQPETFENENKVFEMKGCGSDTVSCNLSVTVLQRQKPTSPKAWLEQNKLGCRTEKSSGRQPTSRETLQPDWPDGL